MKKVNDDKLYYALVVVILVAFLLLYEPGRKNFSSTATPLAHLHR